MKDNTQELDEILVGLQVCIGKGLTKSSDLYKAKHEAKQAILDWHNKQVGAVLDRLESQWGESIDQTMGEPVRFRFVHLSAIEAERKRIKGE